MDRVWRMVQQKFLMNVLQLLLYRSCMFMFGYRSAFLKNSSVPPKVTIFYFFLVRLTQRNTWEKSRPREGESPIPPLSHASSCAHMFSIVLYPAERKTWSDLMMRNITECVTVIEEISRWKKKTRKNTKARRHMLEAQDDEKSKKKNKKNKEKCGLSWPWEDMSSCALTDCRSIRIFYICFPRASPEPCYRRATLPPSANAEP